MLGAPMSRPLLAHPHSNPPPPPQLSFLPCVLSGFHRVAVATHLRARAVRGVGQEFRDLGGTNAEDQTSELGAAQTFATNGAFGRYERGSWPY